MKQYTLLLCFIPLLFSCEKENRWDEEEKVTIDFEKELAEGTPSTFNPVGVWSIYMKSYIVGLSSLQCKTEKIPNGKNKHLYYQLNEDHTYLRCMVEKVDNGNTEVTTEKGTWQQAGNTVRLIDEENNHTDYKVDMNYHVNDYVNYLVQFFSPYKNKMIYNRVRMDRCIHAMEIEAKEAVPYLKFQFERIDIQSYQYLQWNNTIWATSPNGELDVYTYTYRSGYHEDESKFLSNYMLVLHNHGTIKINRHEACDSIDIDIDDYEVVTEGIVHPDASKSTFITYDGNFSYLLPGHHSYPIEYGMKYTLIRRDDEQMDPIILNYYDVESWKIRAGLFYVVPSTFDFSEYTNIKSNY